MKKLLLTLLILFSCTLLPTLAIETQVNDYKSKILGIGFHKKNDLTPELQIRQIFEDYQKYSNNQCLEKLLALHHDSYKSADGYDKENLKMLAEQAWKEFPSVKYALDVINIDVNIDNATVITQEKLSGTVDNSIEFFKGNGFIDSESTAIYYLKRCSNGWKIIADSIITEKTILRYGIAKYIPMSLDAPSLVGPNQEYTAILKVNTPKQYVSLLSITNEPITYPAQKGIESFRALKSSGIQERILYSNNDNKNENAVASVGIAKANIIDDNIDIKLSGMAFLSSRVNVINHKSNILKQDEIDNNNKAD